MASNSPKTETAAIELAAHKRIHLTGLGGVTRRIFQEQP